MIHVDDYSTDTGLRVRVSCDVTGTAIQFLGHDWHKFLERAKAGEFDELATKPHEPFIYGRGGSA